MLYLLECRASPPGRCARAARAYVGHVAGSPALHQNRTLASLAAAEGGLPHGSAEHNSTAAGCSVRLSAVVWQGCCSAHYHHRCCRPALPLGGLKPAVALAGTPVDEPQLERTHSGADSGSLRLACAAPRRREQPYGQACGSKHVGAPVVAVLAWSTPGCVLDWQRVAHPSRGASRLGAVEGTAGGSTTHITLHHPCRSTAGVVESSRDERLMPNEVGIHIVGGPEVEKHCAKHCR